MLPVSRSLLLGLIPLALGGCGVLLGNVKPVTEKSTKTEAPDLAREFPGEWAMLDLPAREGAADKDATLAETPDVAYQSTRTSSIISLNSSCRPNVEEAEDLEVFTHEPFLGVTGISFRERRETTVSGMRALETTLQGMLEGEETKMRSVVTRKGECLYDVLLVSRPRHFPDDEAAFRKFVSGLRLR